MASPPLSPSSAARLQLVTGLVNAWLWAGLAWGLGNGLLGAITPVAGALGWLACGLLPFGALEILMSLHALRSGPTAPWVRRLARLQVAAIVLGGVPSLITGLWVLRRLEDG